MIKTPKQTQYKIMSIDPWLQPFYNDIALRMERHANTRKQLLGAKPDLSSFANGYLYYGINRTESGWVYREWAPGADALHLIAVPVLVTDERAGLLTEERFPYAERRLHVPEAAPMDPAPRDMIVIMTHGHTHDYALLRRAIDTDARYIGVMASRRKAALFRDRLAAEGVSDREVEGRLHCPIGLPIKAETPEEIAVSITAELIAHIRSEAEKIT